MHCYNCRLLIIIINSPQLKKSYTCTHFKLTIPTAANHIGAIKYPAIIASSGELLNNVHGLSCCL